MNFPLQNPDEFAHRAQYFPRTVETGSELLAGYRVIRTLSESSRARIFLGFTDATGSEGESRVAALKLYSGSVQSIRNRANNEVAALTRVGGSHVVGLIDVATTTLGHVCLVLERLERHSLAHVIASRDSMLPGQAVTILAPIAETLDSVHELGVAHRALRASAVLFRSNGTPVVASFGDAELFAPGLSPAALAAHQSVIADRASLVELVRHVLTHAPGAESGAILEWLKECEREGFPDNFGRAVADHLYEIAEPVPVDFAQLSVSRARGLGRVVAVSDPVPTAIGTNGASVGEHSATPISTGLFWISRHLPPFAVSFIEKMASRGRVASAVQRLDESRIVQAFTAVRKPLWIAAGAMACAFVVAVVLVPIERGDGSADSHTGENFTVAHPVDETPVESESVTEQSVQGDEPLAAASALLTHRQRCIRDLSIVCLDDIAQKGSMAMDADVSLIRSIQSGGEPPANSHTAGLPIDDQFELVLAERLGDTALIDITSAVNSGEETTTASLLLMKGEAGWRIRSYMSTAT